MANCEKIKEMFAIQNMIMCQQLSCDTLNLNVVKEDCIHCCIDHDMGKSIPYCELYKELEYPPCQNCELFKMRPLKKYDMWEESYD